MCNISACLPLCLHLYNQKEQSVIRARSPICWGQGPFCLHWFLQAGSKLLLDYVHSCFPHVWGWQIDRCYCANSWKWAEFRTLIAIYHPDFPIEVASLQQRLKGSKIVTSNWFWQCNCFLGWETDSWFFPLGYFPRILHRGFEFYLCLYSLLSQRCHAILTSYTRFINLVNFSCSFSIYWILRYKVFFKVTTSQNTIEFFVLTEFFLVCQEKDWWY